MHCLHSLHPNHKRVFKVLYRSVISLSRSCGCVLPDAISVAVIRLFGKPEVQGERRMGIVLAHGDSLAEARQRWRLPFEKPILIPNEKPARLIARQVLFFNFVKVVKVALVGYLATAIATHSEDSKP